MSNQGGSDAVYMAEALRLAARGRYSTFPNPRVGCVIVRDGAVIGRGWHERAGGPHAEVVALREAGEAARGADLYVTLEPCAHHGRTPPCSEAVVAAGLRRVVAAMQDPNPRVSGRGLARLREAGINASCGLLEPQARKLNRGFVSRMERGRPFITLKLAATLDGRTATAGGESKWITSGAARADVHRLRAEAGAVMTSSATVLADDPALTVRDFPSGHRQPDRIVLDRLARVATDAKVWNVDGARRFWVVGGQVHELADRVHRPPAAAQPSSDLGDVMRQLASLELGSVLLECGPVLAGAFLQAGLVDELVCYLAPSLLGDSANGLARLPGLDRMEQRLRLRFDEVRQVGADLRITASVEEAA